MRAAASFISSLTLIFFIFTCHAEQEKLSPTLEQAIAQYKHENYDEALVLLKKAKDEAPESTLPAYYLGLTYKQLQDYKHAIPALRDAVMRPPKIKGALIELIDCLYQLGQLEEAKQWIVEAEKEGIRPAQTAFLKGMVLVKDGDDKAAIAAFENAEALDKSMAQACEYQIGLAHLKARDYAGAKNAFRELVLIDPNSNMANFANVYMDAISKREETARPFKLTAGVAWQYDDNVVLKPSDTAIAANIADKADSREVYTGSAEYNYRFNEMLGVKGQYFIYYGKQNDLGFYDIVSNTFVVQPSIYFDKGMLTFPAGYNHTIVNDKNYLSSPSTSAILNYMINNSNMAQAFVKYQNKDYLWAPSMADENRDSNDLGGGLGWYIFYAKNTGFLNIRYALNREMARGNNWDYFGNRASATLLVPLHKKLNVTLTGDAFFQSFLNTNSIFRVTRNDQVYTVSALAAYKIYKDSELQFQYTYVKDNSNIDVYEYNRNIFSVGIEAKF